MSRSRIDYRPTQAAWLSFFGWATRGGPRKLKNVAPSYPQAARTESREGVIVVDAIVGTRGCIRSAEVVSGRHLDLAGEALRSVMQWVYTSTLLDGQPVPVMMTVTVNFKLR